MAVPSVYEESEDNVNVSIVLCEHRFTGLGKQGWIQFKTHFKSFIRYKTAAVQG